MHPKDIYIEIETQLYWKNKKYLWIWHRNKSWYIDIKTHIYLCGLKGMEPGIDEAMTKAAEEKGLNWSELRPQLKKLYSKTGLLWKVLVDYPTLKVHWRDIF